MEPVWWISFFILVFVLLAFDLITHRKSHTIGMKEALLWTGFWISLALGFNLVLYIFKGKQMALEFLAGYLIEESLSVDNMFVFLLIFKYFRIPDQFQHKILYWGIIGALVFRAIFVVAGITLVNRFHWIIYIFGAILIFSALKLVKGDDQDVDPEKNPVLRLFRRFYPVSAKLDGDRFFTVENGIKKATPLLVALIAIETTDVVFAVDSIPAVLAVSRDTFIVYSSNVFAILGLRALYFALAGLMKLFHYLHYGLAAVLFFVGCKMLASHWYHVPIGAALGAIIGILGLSIVASLIFPKKEGPEGTIKTGH